MKTNENYSEPPVSACILTPCLSTCRPISTHLRRHPDPLSCLSICLPRATSLRWNHAGSRRIAPDRTIMQVFNTLAVPHLFPLFVCQLLAGSSFAARLFSVFGSTRVCRIVGVAQSVPVFFFEILLNV